MENRTNLVAMMVLGAGIVALGGTIISGEYFHGGRPEKMGYIVEGVEVASEEGAAAVVPIAALMGTADVGKGAEVFKKCTACHSIAQGAANGIGPNLWASMGKPHGHVPGFAYSDALKSKGAQWTFDTMNEWLLSPRKYAPGTKMTFAGLSKPEDRANVIAYLNSQGSNLPLPAAPAAGAGAGAETNNGEQPQATPPAGDVTAPSQAGTDPAKPATG